MPLIIEEDTPIGEETPPKGLNFQLGDDEGYEPKQPKLGKLGKNVLAVYDISARLANTVGLRMTAFTIAQANENAAYAWEQLAQQSPAVKRFLERALESSAIGAVIAANLPIVSVLGMEIYDRFRNRRGTNEMNEPH